jgi:hypothetical protein
MHATTLNGIPAILPAMRYPIPLLLLLSACHASPLLTPAPVRAPTLLVGAFVDDYGTRHVIVDSLWQHGSRNRYHIVRWDAAGQYLIAQNDSSNSAEKGRWSRIDWMPLEGMAPYAWAWCLTAYDAPTRAVAEATPPANRATPKTGCGGYPFTRMRRNGGER